MNTWTPTHPNTNTAWEAVTENLQRRAQDGLWSSREVAITIAKNTGLDRHRAVDLIDSAIRHGYLNARSGPAWCRLHQHNPNSQVRLAVPGPEGSSS